MVIAQLENEPPSELHSKPAVGLVPGVAVTWNAMDVETVDPPFCTRFPLPSVADVMVVADGGVTIVQMKVAGVGSLFSALSTALTLNVCCQAARLL